MAFVDRQHLPGVHHIEDGMGVCFTLLVGRERALLVDAGYGLEDVAACVRGITDLPLTVWLTHAHHDHALGAMWFDSARMHPADAPIWETYTGQAQRRRVLTFPRRGIEVDEAAYLERPMPPLGLCEGEELDLGGMMARVIPCPGHTPGSVVVHVPERGLLLTGDDWNQCTWLFFAEALPIRRYRENLRALLALPFEWALCPHRTELFARKTLEAFVQGLTDGAIAAAEPSDTGNAYGVSTRCIRLDGDQMIVFDADKAKIV